MIAKSLMVLVAAAIGGPVGLAGQSPLAIDPASTSVTWGPCPAIFGTGCELAVLRGAPDRPNADVLLRLAGGRTLPAHRHTSAERMVLVSGKLRVRYQGHPERTLTSGHYAFGPARLPHEATCVGRHSCTLFIAFEGPVDAELTPDALR